MGSIAAPNGLYLYQVYLEDQLESPEYTGQIQLFR